MSNAVMPEGRDCFCLPARISSYSLNLLLILWIKDTFKNCMLNLKINYLCIGFSSAQLK